MAIRLFLYRCTKSGDPAADSPNIYLFDKERVTLSSEEDSDLTLPGIPGGTISIVKTNDSPFTLRKSTTSASVKINDKDLDGDSSVLRNGDKIRIENYLLEFTIEFKGVGQRRKVGLITCISAVLISGIIVLELGLIVVIPKQVAKRQLWGVEITRQRTIELIDVTRSRCEKLIENSENDLDREIAGMIQQELDNIAIYARKHLAQLLAEQVNEIYQDVSHFERILNSLEAGNLFPEKESIESHDYLKEMLEQQDIKQ